MKPNQRTARLPETSSRVYLDYNATAPCRPEVLEVVQDAMANTWGNPSSSHVEGQKARALIERARAQVAVAIGAKPQEIVFTSGGTEADNLAIRGVLQGHPVKTPHIIASTIEHHAVLNPCKHLESRGVRVSLTGCNSEGCVDPKTLAGLLDPDTVMVSIMHVNNEVGTIQPIRKIADLAHAAGAVFHTDAVQSLGKIPVQVDDLGADLLSVSAHKIGGPKGVGALYIRTGTTFEPMWQGGPQELYRRPGTENVPAIAGFGKAVELAVAGLVTETKRLTALKKMFWSGIRAQIRGVHLNGNLAGTVANTLNVSFDGADGEAAMMALDMEGVAVSTGAACALGTVEPSHVLEAMCRSRAICRGALRFSMGPATTETQIRTVLEVLPALIRRLREREISRIVKKSARPRTLPRPETFRLPLFGRGGGLAAFRNAA